MQTADLNARPPFAPASGVTMRAVWGEDALLNLVRLEPGAEVPLHSHPEEQIGFVLSGSLDLVVDGEPVVITEGVAYVVAGGVPHSGMAGTDGCELIDVFAPVRDDYRAAQEAADRG